MRQSLKAAPAVVGGDRQRAGGQNQRLAAKVAVVVASMSVVSVARAAAAVISTLTASEPAVPRFAWSIFRSVTVAKPVPAVVMKSRLPSSSLRPWNVVIWAMRSMASSDESTCNWLAAICSSVRAPVLAASVTRPRMSFSRLLTWPRPLSAVAMSWLARSVLVMALLDAGDVAAEVFAGDQTGRIVLADVDSQTGAQPGEGFLQLGVGSGPRSFWAISELTFVLIRVMFLDLLRFGIFRRSRRRRGSCDSSPAR